MRTKLPVLVHYTEHWCGFGVGDTPRCPQLFGNPRTHRYYCRALLRFDRRERYMPKRWFPVTKHTHVALDDALEQGELFINILKEARNR